MAKSAGRDNEPPGPITRGPKAWQLSQGHVHSPWPPAHELLATPELAQEPLPLARPRRERWSRAVCAAPARLALGSLPSQDAASRGDAGASSPRPSSQLVSQSCWREGRGQIKHRSPALGVQQRRAGTLKPLHCILTDPGPADRGFCCSRSRAKPESRLQNPAGLHRLSKPGQTPAPGAGRTSSRAADQQQSLRTLQKLQPLQRLPKE